MTLADAEAIAAATGRSWPTVRSWASRGVKRGGERVWLEPRGRSRDGRILYSLEQAEEFAEPLDMARQTRATSE